MWGLPFSEVIWRRSGLGGGGRRIGRRGGRVNCGWDTEKWIRIINSPKQSTRLLLHMVFSMVLGIIQRWLTNVRSQSQEKFHLGSSQASLSPSLHEISSPNTELPFRHPLIPVYAQPFWILVLFFLLPLFASWIIALLFLDFQALSLPLLPSLPFSPFFPKCPHSVWWPCSFWNFQMSDCLPLISTKHILLNPYLEVPCPHFLEFFLFFLAIFFFPVLVSNSEKWLMEVSI